MTARARFFSTALLSGAILYAAPAVDFNRDIRPILSDRCFLCHGPDAATRKVDLRLDLEASAKAARGAKTPVVPHKPDASEVLRRIGAANPAMRMPPAYSGRKPLSEAEIALIRRWLEEGAPWQKHWAFLPPERPAEPEVAAKNWPRNPIDRFILARLEREGLKPSPEADRAQLLRRVALDLTGLPPTPAELDAFLKDTSPDAYEKVVDSLLVSPRYGERMALDWLDAARYADTHGYQVDPEKEMWPWRDWVVRAFNANMPYDRFTVEQIAGDLLPHPSLDQVIATGFHRNHRINTEAGSIAEEFQVENLVDRVGTTGTVWLGLTVGCARCHDHKYDPIAMKDFYSLAAYFNNVPEVGTGGPRDGRGNAAPARRLPMPELDAQADALKVKVDAAQAELKQLQARLAEGMAAWEPVARDRKPQWRELRPTKLASDHGVTLTVQPDGSVLVSGALPEKDVYTIEAECPPGKYTAFRLELLPDPTMPGGGSGRGDGGRSVLTLFTVTAAKAIDLALITPNLQAEGSQPELALRPRPQLTRGWFVDDPSQPAFAVVEPSRTFTAAEKTRLSFRLGSEFGNKALLGRFRLSVTDDEFPEPVSPDIVKILSTEASARTPAMQKKLRAYYLRHPRESREAADRLAALQAEQKAVINRIPTTMVMSEMSEPRETFMLARGDYQKPGDRVYPATPGFLPPLAGAPANRLGLAKWLVSSENPLTARVEVNRLWQLFFGMGLVKTAEDFGSQGDPPSHPELLDWLATEFVRSGWNVKALQKQIVMSATYRQSSKATAALLERDPENKLLARGPRFRLPAEMIRDQALAAAGLLSAKMGGPPVKPYQPDGLWEALSVIDDRKLYEQSHGEDLWRRSLYTFWKRTAPPPSMTAFDAPTREYCIVRRDRSSTPLQALVLLNDVTFVEAARMMAQRMLREGGSAPASRISFGFRLATSRQPAGAELKVLEAGLERRLATYQKDPAAAEKLLSSGETPRDKSLDAVELAAYTTVASVILNLDEVMTKE